ncbi:1-acyl-sn-glycerol-3-phosphate acyltransferase gamma isoform X1 [Choloepus didactylus]|uniref:1-acyl-sn-glycerol-3-phosphate acyltransferase gamma isoform X1 n=1 Tax=Choloepus didactylus TaxID=27675 RepID=UPI00189FD883|nr:1-acyl-sn-glycerol-3-phosphate acyltransferase gamma isoform X1 [Choloepus didactylus]XP_037686712.1 1-acyl-sn-glycerol-3-phosphate acyltransferase gamma isoform X1 [Choloepus didactylus]XP_037686713.1 1-acyl-sn-glycerol-3-phosphate acyltransferase gamma isoform X1 [Choloepus didactylus]XP_037686723.1 1-acyl-sn-glycerol-3-phosphate acyltransferase gamma isoform X1 [Choloepus didactylus]
MGLLAFLKTQFLVHLLIGFVFVVSGLVINSIQLCTLVLWPLNKQLYRRVNCRLSYSLWSQLVMLLEWWSGTECTLFTDKATLERLGKEHVVIILNHNFEIDFLCGWTMCERFGVLGSSKVLAKKELLYVPLIGWTWYFLEIVFCKRKWEEDRDTVIEGLKRLADYPEYMWFLLYCEGTRFTETKHRVSMEVAAAKGLPALKYHLLPRTKGFTTAVQCLRGTVAAVYDVTLNFRGNKNPSLLGILYGKKYEADMCVRRFPLEEIPLDEKEAAQWLHKLYQQKENLKWHEDISLLVQHSLEPGRPGSPPVLLWLAAGSPFRDSARILGLLFSRSASALLDREGERGGRPAGDVRPGGRVPRGAVQARPAALGPPELPLLGHRPPVAARQLCARRLCQRVAPPDPHLLGVRWSSFLWRAQTDRRNGNRERLQLREPRI